jgi:hypothetical protein
MRSEDVLCFDGVRVGGGLPGFSVEKGREGGMKRRGGLDIQWQWQ